MDVGTRLPGVIPVSRSPQSRLAAWLQNALSATARKGAIGLLDQAVVSGTSFLTTVLIGRMCGAEELGVYSLGFTIVVLMGVMQESLISTPYTIYANRLQGRRRAEYAGSVLVQHALLSATAMIGLAVVGGTLAARWSSPQLAPVIWTLVGMVPLILVRDFLRRLAFAHLEMTAALVLDGAVSVIQLGGLAWLAWRGQLTAVTAYAAIGLGCLAAGVGWFGLARPNFIVRWSQFPRELRRNWTFGRWIFAAQMASAANLYAIHWLLALVLGTMTTGVFAACMTIVLLSNPFLLGVSNVLSPRLARGFVDGGVAEVRRVVAKATVVVCTAMAAFCVAIAVAGDVVVRLLYDGPEYAGHGLLITLLALSSLCSAASLAADNGLWAMERPDVNFKASLIGLAVTLVIASAAVTTWGLVGAALGYLIGVVAASAIRWLAFVKLAGVTGECR